MIGLVVTGHGNFASGLSSSVDLIAGPQPHYVAVDFDGSGTDRLEEDLKNAYAKLSDCDGIIVFSDLAGGSPFKTAALLAASETDIRVLAGTNLPMLCEIVMARTMIEDLGTLVATALSVGKDGVQEFVMPVLDDEPIERDGI